LKDEHKNREIIYCRGHVNGGYKMTLGKIQKITYKGQSDFLAQVEKVQVNNMKAQITAYY